MSALSSLFFLVPFYSAVIDFMLKLYTFALFITQSCSVMLQFLFSSEQNLYCAL